jgi:hypothetical protein
MLWAVRRSSNSEQQQEVRAPMLSLRTHALIAAGLFAGLLVIGWGGSLLDASGLAPHEPALQIAALVLVLGLCAALAFSAAPLMVLTVLRFQVSIGNANRPVIRTMIAHQRTIVFVMWGLMAAGLLLAVPAAILDGPFDMNGPGR